MNAAYVRHMLAAAVRAARFDRDAVADFDHSYEGFFRSFFALVLCAPLYVFTTAAQWRFMADAARTVEELAAAVVAKPTIADYTIELIGYAAVWIAFPLAMIAIAKLLHVGGRYVPFIIAYNWSACVVYAVAAVPYLLYLAGLPSLLAVAILYYVAGLYIFVYRWRIAKDALQVTGSTAAGIVMFDLLLSLLVLWIAEFSRALLLGAS